MSIASPTGYCASWTARTTPAGLTGATWIDLIEPTAAQEETVETLLHVSIPNTKQVRTTDESSQAYRDGDALVMTARVISKSASSDVRLISVTFILIGNTLITLRYGDPMPFRTFIARAEKEAATVASGETVMVGLLETIVDRAAEILQTVGDELEMLSTDIVTRDGTVSGSGNRADLPPTLQTIGRDGYLANRVRLSLHSLARIIPYLPCNKVQGSADGNLDRLDTVANDIQSLLSHDGHVMSSVNFLLDATLGLISIQQNAIIKIFSVAAVIFLPPTLIASIHGINFDHMPELKWLAGYPFAMLLMMASAALPYLFFKRLGWL